ncbi:50S ribosomal protein L29 [Chlamydiales bacterium STE3]|nr:50S ribosomal protein L29 [Chlamydiales bacterium STE3]
MKGNELRDQSVQELQALLGDKKAGLFELKNKLQREKKADKPHELNNLKKDIARIHTILREKELAS